MKEKITRILYQNSTDDSECMRIKFESIQKVIGELSNLLDKEDKWLPTGYHEKLVKNCPLEDGEYYHIGFLCNDGRFVNQGIKQFNEGFMDDNNYHLKPFPTHYIKIEKPSEEL